MKYLALAVPLFFILQSCGSSGGGGTGPIGEMANEDRVAFSALTADQMYSLKTIACTAGKIQDTDNAFVDVKYISKFVNLVKPQFKIVRENGKVYIQEYQFVALNNNCRLVQKHEIGTLTDTTITFVSTDESCEGSQCTSEVCTPRDTTSTRIAAYKSSQNEVRVFTAPGDATQMNHMLAYTCSDPAGYPVMQYKK